MNDDVDRTDLELMRKLADEQQVEHVHRAHIQALKWLMENRCPLKLSVESSLAYYQTAKQRLSVEELKDLNYLMGHSEDVDDTLAKIYNLLQNYPDLKEGFGIFLPPNMNLQFQAGAYSVPNNAKNEKGLADKKETQKNNPSIEEMMNMPSCSKETYFNAPPEVSDKFLDKKDLILTNENDDEFAKSYLFKVKERFVDKPEVYEKFSELLDSVIRYTLQGNDSGIEEIFLQITELFINHEDLIEEFKAFLLSSSSEESAEKDKALMNFPFVHDSAVASVYQYGTYEELRFFDKMKEACGYPEVYHNFLKFLQLYNENYVTKSKLVEITKCFFGGRPDLYKEFKDILGFNES
ncbi:paired amphipathic helix protein Sin3b, partial [Caerostris extrusa]